MNDEYRIAPAAPSTVTGSYEALRAAGLRAAARELAGAMPR
ncbi:MULTISPECIES: hypothetical protein [unclassified Streptomyces]|nr:MULTISPECIES: hypothetical protein [unclassified Streptomyces]